MGREHSNSTQNYLELLQAKPKQYPFCRHLYEEWHFISFKYHQVCVIWKILSADEVKRNIAAAMSHWETQTCIRFVNRTTQHDFIVINEGRCG